jgi:hypothetical protein
MDGRHLWQPDQRLLLLVSATNIYVPLRSSAHGVPVKERRRALAAAER